MQTPIISIIMPVYNMEKFLPETLLSIQAQTFENFEVICVDDGSIDHSAEILKRISQQDERFVYLYQNNAGAGAARNYGFSNAKGKYAIFLDSDDLFSPLLLEKLYDAITTNEADIAACNFSKFNYNGTETQHEGVHTRWIPNGLTVFSYRDTPDYIMRVINPTPWNKLYRSEFIREKGLKYEEISSTNDITFAAVSVAAAERVTYIKDSLVRYRVGHSGTISATKTKNLNNVAIAIDSAVRQASMLPHCELIRNSILSFVVDNYIVALSRYIKDFSAPEAAEFYQRVHNIFNHEAFDNVDPRVLHNPKQYREFCTVRKHDYETMKRLVSRRLIVSLTTYPRRIGSLHQVLESIYAQTRKADEVILWLAEEQFHGKEADLPEPLLQLVSEHRLTIRWCDDLKPHKKYFYALQEYFNDLVVTIDDDLLYSKDMLSSLYASYLLYPDAVSTVRAHLIVLNEHNEILPYDHWIQETDACIYEPSMQLMATGGAGVLHPPGLFRKEFFDKTAIVDNCLWADDLWLKAMQLVSDVPVVVARPFEPLQYLPDSQEEALHIINVRQHQNDVQLENIRKWLDDTFEPGILIDKLTVPGIGTSILGTDAVAQHLDRERKANRTKLKQTENKLSQTENRLKQSATRLSQTENKWRQSESKLNQTEKKLRQTEDKLRQSESKLNQTAAKLTGTEKKLKQKENKLRQVNEKLKQSENRLSKAEKSKPIGRQLKALGKHLRKQRDIRGFSVSLALKFLIYYLAWIPEKLLAAMMYCLKHGFKNTLKRILGVFRAHK